MGVTFKNAPVHVGAGIPLVGITDDVLDLAGLTPGGLPLPPRGITAAAPAPQAGGGNLVDDLFRLRLQRLPQGPVAAPGGVFGNAAGVDIAAVPGDDLQLRGVKRGLIQDRAGLRLSGQKDPLPGQQHLVGIDLADQPVFGKAATACTVQDLPGQGLVNPAIDQARSTRRLHRDQRFLLTPAQAAGGDDLKIEPSSISFFPYVLVNSIRTGCQPAGRPADGDPDRIGVQRV